MSARVRIAVVAYHYPPDPAVGSQRPARLVSLLRARDVDVEVFTNGGACAEGAGEDGVHAVRSWPSVRQALLRLRDRLRKHPARVRPGATIPNPRAESTSTGPVARVAGGLRGLLVALAWLPDDHQGFVLPALNALIKRHREAPFSIVFVTAPPFSPIIAATLFSRHAGLPLWIELRDPWSDADARYARSSRPVARLDRWLEEACLRQAAGVVAVTPSVAAQLASRDHPDRRSSYHVVRSGISMLRSSAAPARRAVLLHSGTLYLDRDPTPLLAGLSRLRADGRLPSLDVRLLFLGDGREFMGRSVADMASEHGIADLVEFQDHVPQRQARQLADEAAVLVLLAQRQPRQIPQKLYDYLATRKPILAFVDDDGESAALLRAVGGHHVLPPSPEPSACAKAILSSLEQGLRGDTIGDDATLAELTAERSIGHLADHLAASCQSREK